jgi:acetolactate synthase-1/2/3 large subunit
MLVKYSDVFIDDLVRLGYTHCFFVGGGNVMHLLESARTRMECVAVVHEVSAGIAAEYFNVAMREKGKKAVAIVTAGPGLTNIVTAIGAAWLESRELLVIGGQARTEFLSRGTVRQIGHQEIDGVGVTSAITKASIRVEKPMSFEELKAFTEISSTGRKGPVFLELCLDVSATYVEQTASNASIEAPITPSSPAVFDSELLGELWNESERPLLLVGQGLDFKTFVANRFFLEELALPTATSWNAADYLSFDDSLYAGRPNTYGMRWSNAVVQQCDLLVVVGARLGLQQTGFNWEEFAPLAKIIHVDIDPLELSKANPGTDVKILADANLVFEPLLEIFRSQIKPVADAWLDYIQRVKRALLVNEVANQMFDDYVNPFAFMDELSNMLKEESILIPCSSGGAYTTVMQGFRQTQGQLLTNDKGSASMGYGLAGAIGTSIAMPDKRVVLLEGDGGFAQNLSEVGTVANRNLNLKMVVFSNGGYASIRLSQKAYFHGNYIGCDAETGVGLPNWSEFFAAYGIPSVTISGSLNDSSEALNILSTEGPGAIILNVSKEQPFYPKLTSRIFPDGSMKSNPIHLMFPPLENTVADAVFAYLPESLKYPE